LGASVLAGITRDSVIRIARDFGYEVREQMLPREILYTCDEAFFTGSAAEITPLATVDKITVGPGMRGPLQKKYKTPSSTSSKVATTLTAGYITCKFAA
jgi:branched-chain amino acid aminotransferase